MSTGTRRSARSCRATCSWSGMRRVGQRFGATFVIGCAAPVVTTPTSGRYGTSCTRRRPLGSLPSCSSRADPTTCRGAAQSDPMCLSDAPCYVCFQPGKDVMVPGHPGLIDYPSHECHSRLQQLDGFTAGPAGSPQPRANRPQMLFGGAVWTIGQGPGLYEPSRLVLYLCHKNASRLRQRDYLVVQTETQPESVYPQVEPRIDLHARARQAAYCGARGEGGRLRPSRHPAADAGLCRSTRRSASRIISSTK